MQHQSLDRTVRFVAQKRQVMVVERLHISAAPRARLLRTHLRQEAKTVPYRKLFVLSEIHSALS